jgi:hypothetical protein
MNGTAERSAPEQDKSTIETKISLITRDNEATQDSKLSFSELTFGAAGTPGPDTLCNHLK